MQPSDNGARLGPFQREEPARENIGYSPKQKLGELGTILVIDIPTLAGINVGVSVFKPGLQGDNSSRLKDL